MAVKSEKHEQQDKIRLRILHVLSIYPIISPTMLQGGLGPQVKTALWRPILQSMVSEGLVDMRQESLMSPEGRYNAHILISLTDKGKKRVPSKVPTPA